MINTTNKTDLRKLIRDKRKSLSDIQQAKAAQGLLSQLLVIPEFLSAEKIALYLCNDGEIDPVEVMQWCWKNSRQAYVPRVVQNHKNSLLFAQVTENTEFTENRYGISEPVVAQEQLLSAQDLDLVLMPLVAFDDNGNRLGMGGGFYDTTFEFIKKGNVVKPHLIGIAHEIQKVENIEAESWDIPLSTVVSDSRVYNLTIE